MTSSPALQSPPPASTAAPDLAALIERQRAHFAKHRPLPCSARRELLERLLRMMEAGRLSLRAAIQADFHRADVEIDMTEYAVCTMEIRHALRHLRGWMKPRRVSTPLSMLGTRGEVRCEPRGVNLIIAPWNYPVQLAILPLLSALAAGNTAILKPSELTPHSARWLRENIASAFQPEEVAVVEGGIEVSTELLKHQWAHIFFTGSPQVGKVVMRAAAEHLTPVTLELGGKSPTIVDATADIPRAAEVIAWGKCMNAGQICIAPDYVLVDERVHDELVREMGQALDRFHGTTPAAKEASPDFPRIVNHRHTERLQGLLDDARAQGAIAATGGFSNASERFIAPTVLTGVPPTARVAKEEIFGPLLPVFPFGQLDEAIAFIQARENPLCLYLFSRNPSNVEEIIARTSSGGAVVNDVLMHYMNANLPFGGAGWSGLGRCHGEAGFRTFSNERSVLHRQWDGPVRFWLHPPYGEKVQRLVDLMARWL